MEKQKSPQTIFLKVAEGYSWPHCFLQCLHWQNPPSEPQLPEGDAAERVTSGPSRL